MAELLHDELLARRRERITSRPPRASARPGSGALGVPGTISQLQRQAGNRAVTTLLSPGGALAVQRARGAAGGSGSSRIRPVKPTAEQIREEGRARRRGAAEQARSDARSERSARFRNLNPSVGFEVGDPEAGTVEKHQVFAEVVNGRPLLMIASIPLPIAAFIQGMDARFQFLLAEGARAPKMPKWFTDRSAGYPGIKLGAETELAAADLVFANGASTYDQKRQAETALAGRLHDLIAAVTKMSALLGKHFAIPGKQPAGTTMEVDAWGAPRPDSYLTFLRDAPARYDIEGLVARYADMPDFEGSGFERDHQPHNDLIERMARLPEFAGRELQRVAAGRTQRGWAIMLYHDRHAAGRTFSTKGGQVTATFLSDLAAARPTLTTPDAVRDWCIDYLIQSMRQDVAAMLAVVAQEASYLDLAGSEAAAVAMRAKVRTQIEAGEQRILGTEDSIRGYKDA